MFKPEHINKDFPYYEKLIRLINEEEKLRERDRSGLRLIFLGLIGLPSILGIILIIYHWNILYFLIGVVGCWYVNVEINKLDKVTKELEEYKNLYREWWDKNIDKYTTKMDN